MMIITKPRKWTPHFRALNRDAPHHRKEYHAAPLVPNSSRPASHQKILKNAAAATASSALLAARGVFRRRACAGQFLASGEGGKPFIDEDQPGSLPARPGACPRQWSIAAAGPIEPIIFNGRPTTIRPTASLRISAMMGSAAWSGEETARPPAAWRIGRLHPKSASPMRLAPRSWPEFAGSSLVFVAVLIFDFSASSLTRCASLRGRSSVASGVWMMMVSERPRVAMRWPDRENNDVVVRVEYHAGLALDRIVMIVHWQRLGQRRQEPMSSHCTFISTVTTRALPLFWLAGS